MAHDRSAAGRKAASSAALTLVTSTRAWARRELGYRPFLILLGSGIFVRLAVMVMYWPAWLQSVDSPRFARIDPQAIFGDYWMPAAYAVFAKSLRDLIPALGVTIVIQHLIGLAIGVALYLAVRRLGAVKWVACVPAGVAFLSGDHVWLEHQIMADPFMTALVAFGLACVVRGLVPELDRRWLGAGSALLMAAALTRSVALPLVPVLGLITAIWVGGGARMRAGAVLVAVLPALAVFGLYVGAFELEHGQYLGLGDMGGWNLYSRVAPFADCSDFTPPAGTSQLCEHTPPAQRVGSLGYEWDSGSFGRRQLPLGAQTSATMERFAVQVILHQPGSYVNTVLTDLARFVDPSVGPQRAYSGQPRELLSFGLRDPATLKLVQAELSKGYTGLKLHVVGRQILTSYQNLFRVGGLVLALLVALTFIGMFLARGPARLGVFLFGSAGLVLYAVPVLTLSYDFRYGIPPETFVVVSGTLGGAALIARATGARLLTSAPDPAG